MASSNANKATLPVTPERLMGMYEQLLNHSDRMLAWARENRWSALISEEAGYVSALNGIATAEATVILTAQQHERKSELLEMVRNKNEETYQRLLARRMELSLQLTDAKENEGVTTKGTFGQPCGATNEYFYMQ